MKLINKNAVLAEIERLDALYHTSKDLSGDLFIKGLFCFLDTSEVKEVDLQKEIDRVWDNTSDNFSEDGWKEFEDIAKHFFELGLRASNPLTWKDIDLILDITDQIANDDSMEEKLNNMSQEEYCTEILKRFKALKGEKV